MDQYEKSNFLNDININISNQINYVLSEMHSKSIKDGEITEFERPSACSIFVKSSSMATIHFHRIVRNNAQGIISTTFSKNISSLDLLHAKLNELMYINLTVNNFKTINDELGDYTIGHIPNSLILEETDMRPSEINKCIIIPTSKIQTVGINVTNINIVKSGISVIGDVYKYSDYNPCVEFQVAVYLFDH